MPANSLTFEALILRKQVFITQKATMLWSEAPVNKRKQTLHMEVVKNLRTVFKAHHYLNSYLTHTSRKAENLASSVLNNLFFCYFLLSFLFFYDRRGGVGLRICILWARFLCFRGRFAQRTPLDWWESIMINPTGLGSPAVFVVGMQSACHVPGWFTGSEVLPARSSGVRSKVCRVVMALIAVPGFAAFQGYFPGSHTFTEGLPGPLRRCVATWKSPKAPDWPPWLLFTRGRVHLIITK